MGRESADEAHLLRAIELAHLSRANGNHPFGSLLVDASGRVVLEAENTAVTEIGRVVYALGSETMMAIVNDVSGSGTLALSCREVLARGGRNVEVSGPHLEEQARPVHEGFWN